MKKKKETKKMSSLPMIICIVILLLAIAFLPKLDNIFWKTNDTQVEKQDEKKEKVPNRYQCSYGPAVDSFYNYMKYEYVIFNFDEKGNISNLDSETKYQVTSVEEYNNMLQVLTLSAENVTYDKENYVVTVRSSQNTTFPENYKELKQYLSTNQYTCIEE